MAGICPAIGRALITTDKLDYSPGQRVVIKGSGWQPGEIVTLVQREKPSTHAVLELTAKADAGGGFRNDSFVVEPHDTGVTFTLTARGGTSGSVAERAYTDGNVKAKASAGSTFTLTKTTYATTDCTGTPTAATIIVGVGSTGNTTGVGNTQSVKLQAAVTSDQGGSFTGWTSSFNCTAASPCNTATNPICVVGFAGEGVHDYFANYGTQAQCPVITLSPTSLPNGIVGGFYSQQLTASGGTGPYTFALCAVLCGTLPTVLNMSSAGLISGTPNATGTFGFTIQATDTGGDPSGCQGGQDYTITIDPTPPIPALSHKGLALLALLLAAAAVPLIRMMRR